jgi:hypothetical protein
MSKNRIYTAAALASLMATGAAMAGDPVPTEWFELGAAPLGGGESFSRTFDLSDLVLGDGGSLGVVGFEVMFDYDEEVPDDSWASDALVNVDSSFGFGYQVGGFDNIGTSDAEWSFQGPGSDGPGTYGDSGADIFLPWIDDPILSGTIDVRFANDWGSDPNPNFYEAAIRFYQVVPTPGALALLGLAGIVGRRRRRL